MRRLIKKQFVNIPKTFVTPTKISIISEQDRLNKSSMFYKHHILTFQHLSSYADFVCPRLL